MTERVALVTGASGGIGRATAMALARSGAAVACGYATNDAGAKETVALIEEAGGTAAAFGGDIADPSAVEDLFRQVAEWRGAPLIVVNNAGTNRDGLAVKFPPQEFARILTVNLTGAFLCIQQSLPAMLKARWGRIINVSSVVAIRGNAGQPAYSAAKSGLLGLTRSLAKEYGRRGITVNAVCPGYVQTDMTSSLDERQRQDLRGVIPAGRVGEAEEIAAAIAFLASEEASYVNGVVLPVDGGMTA
ncbi:MAG TPA: 3-oxoacyl-ACP reductase FabG [Actinomycetota bacterium]|nr:3-oxoacyl-ACP reductase FabG [Actinomycetota bacterium]